MWKKDLNANVLKRRGTQMKKMKMKKVVHDGGKCSLILTFFKVAQRFMNKTNEIILVFRILSFGGRKLF